MSMHDVGADPEAEPDTLARFARDLRELRLSSGDATLASLQERIGVSKTVLSDALGGKHLPTERTLRKLVTELGSDVNQWLSRRAALVKTRAAQPETPGGTTPTPATPPTPTAEAVPAPDQSLVVGDELQVSAAAPVALEETSTPEDNARSIRPIGHSSEPVRFSLHVLGLVAASFALVGAIAASIGLASYRVLLRERR